MATTAPPARAWYEGANFAYSERERWICIYPAYLNGKKTAAQGRRVSKKLAVDNPTFDEIKQVCAAAGLRCGVENKVYPRELEVRDQKAKGRIRVQLKEDDGTPCQSQFPNRRALLMYIATMIPKLKSRSQVSGSGGAAASSGTATAASGSSGTSGSGSHKKGRKKK